MDLGERAYEQPHIQAVLTEIGKNFPKYFQSFCPSAAAANKAFAKAIKDWEQDAPPTRSSWTPTPLRSTRTTRTHSRAT